VLVASCSAAINVAISAVVVDPQYCNRCRQSSNLFCKYIELITAMDAASTAMPGRNVASAAIEWTYLN
jgi:tagatose-1,6-bisphosphate aldolase